MHLNFQSTYFAANMGKYIDMCFCVILFRICKFGSNKKSRECNQTRIIVNKVVICRIRRKKIPVSIIYSPSITVPENIELTNYIVICYVSFFCLPP